MADGHRLLLENARQVVLVCARGERFLARDALRSLAVLEGASLVVGTDGFIKAIGPADAIQKQFSEETFQERIDCSGKCILPGLVDAHTHPVWAGERVHEFAMKLAGATYMDIHQAGGGINFTVERTRQASEEELFSSFQQRLGCMMRAGTTLVECKSGYGLSLETELKMLRVIERARRELDISISATYCGAHSVPKGKTATEAADDIINNHLPKLKELGRNGEIHVDNIDVFCEKGVFDLDSTRRILQSGKDIGLQINFHGDELHPMKAAEPMVMHLACVNMRMSMPEALAAATINAAYALGKSHTHGSLEVGKRGDLIIINSSRWEHLIYQFGGHHELIDYVIAKGKVIYKK
ncbi:probable imidazolonepropionase isoform X2 [Tursiops truncatus]|uniref:probable imidazolonepropionase isoform X2 n=1 Tax=Tursiops truncatus TaxID=9739 RepID=UPI003CCEFD8E